MRLQNKVAVVTGAASGFGEGIAKRFAKEGARVILADLNEDGGERVASEIGDAARFRRTDVANPDQAHEMVDAAIHEFGGLDILVNNAGYTHLNKPMLEVTEEEIDRIVAVNVKAIFYATQRALPQFRAQGGGVMINIASTAGVRPRPGLVWYNASKGMVISLTRSMAIELAAEQIRVCALNPVAGDTPLLARFMGEDTPEKRAAFTATVPIGRLSTPRDVANAALFLASDEADFLTGVCLDVDGGRCV